MQLLLDADPPKATKVHVPVELSVCVRSPQRDGSVNSMVNPSLKCLTTRPTIFPRLMACRSEDQALPIPLRRKRIVDHEAAEQRTVCHQDRRRRILGQDERADDFRWFGARLLLASHDTLVATRAFAEACAHMP